MPAPSGVPADAADRRALPAPLRPLAPLLARLPVGFAVLGEAFRFAVVGVLGVVLDVGLFNVARIEGIGPLTSKALSTTVATIVSYFVNRHWSFSARARSGIHRELTIFVALSAVGLGIAEACLAVSHYGFGYTSRLADNLSANGVGLVLGTVWRFWSFRRWVFRPIEQESDARRDAAIAAGV